MAKMTDEEIDEMLAGVHVAVLCTADAAARPEGSPVWYDYVRGTIRVLVHRGSRKARNIRDNSRVSVTVDTRSAPYRGVILRGTATLSGPDPDLRRRLAHKYLARDTADRYLAASSHLDTEDALVTVALESRYSWDYSKGF